MNCDELKDGLQKRKEKIDTAFQESEKARTAAAEELEKINTTILPAALAHQILEPASMVEVLRWKRRRTKLKTIIDDYPLLMKGLEIDQAKNRVLKQRLERYQSIKDRLQAQYDSELEKRLLEMAQTIDCMDDGEEFIGNLKNRK